MTTPEHPLPPRYLTWLASLPSDHLVRFKKRHWEFSSLEELDQPRRVNKTKATFATQLSAFVVMYRTLGATAALGPRKTDFGFDRLVRSIVLAEDNDELLFVDPDDNFSLFNLVPEDLTVTKVASDIFTFIEGATVEDLDDD